MSAKFEMVLRRGESSGFYTRFYVWICPQIECIINLYMKRQSIFEIPKLNVVVVCTIEQAIGQRVGDIRVQMKIIVLLIICIDASAHLSKSWNMAGDRETSPDVSGQVMPRSRLIAPKLIKLSGVVPLPFIVGFAFISKGSIHDEGTSVVLGQ